MSQTSVSHSGFGVGTAVAKAAAVPVRGGGCVSRTTWSFGPIQLSFHKMTEVACCHEASAWPHWSVPVVETMYRPNPSVMTEPSSFQP